MKLNDEKSVKVCQQALFSKQLQYYSNLCKIYEELANIAISKNRLRMQNDRTISEQVSSIYGNYLTMAVDGDLSFLEDKNNYIINEDGTTYERFNEKQFNLIRHFSKYASLISQFKDASQLLEDATRYKDGSLTYFGIDEEKLDEYHDFMEKTSRQTKNFDTYISQSPLRAIGRNSFKKTSNAIKQINKIDSEHINWSKDSKFYQERLTPKAFGANIYGARGSVRRRLISPKKVIESEFNTIYTKQEMAEFRKKPSKVAKLAENIYVAANKTKEFFKARKGTLKRAGLIAGVIATLGGTGKHVYDAHIFNHLSVNTNTEKGFDVLINKDTQDQLASIRREIDSLKTISELPSDDYLDSIINSLDSTTTNVISDLMKKAIKEKYPNYSDIQLEDRYDLNINKNIGSGQPSPQEFIVATAKNEKGEDVKLRYDSFVSTAIFKNPLRDSIYNEEILDGASISKDSLAVKIHEKIKSIRSNSSETLANKINNLEDVTKELENILEDLEHLAGCEFDIIPFNYVLVSAPDKVKSIDEKNKNDQVIVENPENEENIINNLTENDGR